MKQRCSNPNMRNWKNYGGRGIFVCLEWLNDPRPFVYWALRNGWRKGLTVERVDNDGPYSPENCTIATYKTQNRNNQQTKLTQLDVDEIHRRLELGEFGSHIARDFGVTKQTIYEIKRGHIWTDPGIQQPVG